MVTELGPPVSEFSTRITNFMTSLLPNANYVKRETKTDHPLEYGQAVGYWDTPGW